MRPISGQSGLGLGVADHEQRRLDALAADGEERQRRARRVAPVSSARAISPRSSPDMVAAAFFIQSTIVVTIATATSEAMPAMASAARPEMVFSPNWMTRNTATVIDDGGARRPATPT